MSDGFLGRWSKRKLEVKEGKAVEAEPARLEPLPPPQPSPEGGGSKQPSAGGEGGKEVPVVAGGSEEMMRAAGASEQGNLLPPPLGEGRGGGVADQPPSAAAAADQLPPLTLEDVKALTTESDFTRFAASDVAPEVKNAALKKLFTDPRYNIMDGLDVYIDDYSKPDPIPHSMLRQLVSAKFLGLFDQEEKEEAEAAARQARDVADNPTVQSVAQSDAYPPAVPEPTDNADTDLRLQQDDAPPGEDPGRGAE